MRIKKIGMMVVAIAFSLSVCAKSPKYVFYFIGDGMGLNQILGTQMYLSDLDGKIGIKPLCFTQFPSTGYVTTFSSSSFITDSSASGTALASGNKTNNDVLGMLSDRSTPSISIADRAGLAGRQVAIGTTVSINHATPAVFYAHAANRNMYHQIGMQLGSSKYVGFIAGNDFQQPFDNDSTADEGCYRHAEQNGFTIVRGYDQYKEKARSAQKMIMLQPNPDNLEHMPYALDRKDGDLSLADMTSAAIDFMMKDSKAGFFMMMEGGRIDQSCHGNDPATCFNEVIDFDNAVQVAYNFYLKHKDETLIVVSADHETGAIGLGNGEYRLNLKVLQYQDMSEEAFSKYLSKKCTDAGHALTWEEVEAELTAHFGFWDKVKLSQKQTDRLRAAYVQSLGMGYGELKSEEYYDVDGISDEAVRIISEIAQISWGTGAHSAGYVPVFAIGNGAHNFAGQLDNTQLPRLIAKAAGYRW